MIRLAIDVMGGDHGVAPLVQGALAALHAHPTLHITLIGDADQIHPLLHSSSVDRLTVAHNSLAVDMQDDPLAALRSKAGSSMAAALDMLVENTADGVVSAGNTGALVAFSVQKLGMLEGVSRPAICTQVPTNSGKTWLLDLGATLTNNHERLVELARLGATQSRIYDRKSLPKVALLNVGVEILKGTEELNKAASLLVEESGFQYSGYVEGSSIFKGDVDVVVCDGFSGNVAIKTAQGVAELITAKFSTASKSSLWSRTLLWIASPVLRHVGRQVDPSLYNGAPLLGLRGLVVKSHGNTAAKGFKNAISVAVNTLSRSADYT